MNLSTTNPIAPDRDGTLWRAEKLHAGIVTDTVNLEGNPFTLPEVQTLLDGVTVGGHRLSDADQVVNQSESWNQLISLVREQTFTVTKETACALNAFSAKNEALRWGEFRDREVTISGTDWKPPKSETLDDHFDQLLERIGSIPDVFIRAMTVFLDMARNQYFFDGNKRTGRLMMNGIILDAGFDVLSIPYKRQQEFNEKMIRFYDTGEQHEMFEFLLSCSTTPHDKPFLA